MTMTVGPDDRAEASSLDVSSIEQSLFFQIKRTQSLLGRHFQLRLGSFDLRPAEYGILSLIATNPGRKQTEIADALDIQRANFVPLINALEQRRLVERRVPQRDKRSNALYLTPDGLAFVKELAAVEARFEAECSARLGGAKARNAFLSLLAKLAA